MSSEAVPPGQAPSLEIAHVLCMDIVAYSRLPMEDQSRLLLNLQNVIRDSSEFQRAQADDQLLRLPTGDGMALIFFKQTYLASFAGRFQGAGLIRSFAFFALYRHSTPP
jgi:hypothetical protein